MDHCLIPFLYRRFQIPQILEDGLFQHSFKENHGERFDPGEEANGCGFMRAGEKEASVCPGNGEGGGKNIAIHFGPGFEKGIVNRFGNPLVDGGGLSEIHPRFPPF